MTDDSEFAAWLRDNPPPDLAALIERAGRRYAKSIGEEYIADPFRRAREAPHQGGYQCVTPEEWAAYDAAMAVWQAAYRSRTAR